MAPPRTIQELIKYENSVAEGFRAHDCSTLISRGCGAVDNPDMTGRSSAIRASEEMPAQWPVWQGLL